MSSSIVNNPKKLTQLLWLAAGVIFVTAVVRSLGPDSSTEWASKAKDIASMLGDSRLAMKEHMRLAEASWAKTVKQRHELIKADYGSADKLPLYPAVDTPSYFAHPYTIWDFTPASYGCPHEMERVGRMGDGGKWVCGMSRYEATSRKQPCVVYSFGVRDESSFENELLSRTDCEIWAYDFSVVDFGMQLESANRHRAHFTQAGIAGETDTTRDPPFYSIADLMKMNGHDYIDILKMDIEFAEFEAMDGFSRDFPNRELPLGQFMVEVHFFNDFNAKNYLEWWERLEARGLRPTWTEPNLLAVTVNLSGDKMPNLAEYTLLNVQDKRNVIFGGIRASD